METVEVYEKTLILARYNEMKLIRFYLFYQIVISCFVIGPLTMNENGKTILYGLVSGLGTEFFDFKRLRTLYFRVATPDA